MNWKTIKISRIGLTMLPAVLAATWFLPVAAQLPDEQIWLGLTPARLLVWGHGTMSGKPKGLKLTVPSTDLVGVDLEKQKTTYAAVLRFADGSAKVYEAPKMFNDPEAFASAVNDR